MIPPTVPPPASHRPEFLRARKVLLERLEDAKLGVGWAPCSSFSSGMVSGIELAVTLFDAAEADRNTGVVTEEILRFLVTRHETVLLDAEAAPVAGEPEMSLVPRVELEHLRHALEGALALIAKRPAAPVDHRGGCAGHALDDVTTRPRVPGPAL